MRAFWASETGKIFGRLHVDKMLRMDFQDADDPKTLALLNQIMEDENWASWGLWKLKDAFSRLEPSMADQKVWARL